MYYIPSQIKIQAILFCSGIDGVGLSLTLFEKILTCRLIRYMINIVSFSGGISAGVNFL